MALLRETQPSRVRADGNESPRDPALGLEQTALSLSSAQLFPRQKTPCARQDGMNPSAEWRERWRILSSRNN